MLDINQFYAQVNEEPLDRIVDDGGFSGIFRTVACIGDSLSSGEFESIDDNGNTGWNDMFEYSVIQYLARAAGFKAYNFTRGGMTASEYWTYAENMGYWDTDKLAQAYVMALGCNDVINDHQPIGSIDDVNFEDYNKNANTFAGHYAKIIQRVKSMQPEARFFLVTFPRHKGFGTKEQIDGMCKVMYDFAAKFSHCYVVDLAKYMPEVDDEFNRNFSMHGHRNSAGYQVYAKILGSYIDYIIRHNPQEFDDVGFIGTGLHK